jgi:hypothetical protein
MPERRLYALILLLAPGTAVGQPPANIAAPPILSLSAPVDVSPFAVLTDRRLKFGLNPGPFTAKLMSMPDAAPVEPRDSPFDAKGQPLVEGPNSSPFWNPATDLDLAAGMRLTPRSDILVGFALGARGRFTPSAPSTTPGGPSVYFLQLSRKW